MTGGDAILFAFIFILGGSVASIFTFIAGNLMWEKVSEHIDVTVEKDANN